MLFYKHSPMQAGHITQVRYLLLDYMPSRSALAPNSIVIVWRSSSFVMSMCSRTVRLQLVYDEGEQHQISALSSINIKSHWLEVIFTVYHFGSTTRVCYFAYIQDISIRKITASRFHYIIIIFGSCVSFNPAPLTLPMVLVAAVNSILLCFQKTRRPATGEREGRPPNADRR